MAMRPRRWLAGVLCAAAIGAAGSCHKPPSAETNSYYMARNSPADAAQLGCYNSGKSGRMTLFFGSPTTSAGVQGVTVWGAPNLTVAQVGQTVMDFVRGYAYCRSDPGHRLLIGIGTSNSAIDDDADDWLYAHGRAWGTMVRDVAHWVATYYPWHARIYGAYDFEPSWSSPWKAHHWMAGYDGTAGRPGLYANASADGCPTTTATGGACDNGWNQWWVWHMGWEFDSALPFPQIYATSGVNARQWQLVDLYATVHLGDGMYFYGTTSQWGACRQVGGCAGTDNTIHQAHDQLVWWLATDARTHQDAVDGMTDLSWNS
jgi:hypothetical protein